MTKKIDLATALKIIDAARQKAQDIKVPMNIAVVDEGNNLVAFQRMDGAWLGSINIAQNKAYTARAFNMSTKELAPLCQPGQPLFGIHASNDGRLIMFSRGNPSERWKHCCRRHRRQRRQRRAGSGGGWSRRRGFLKAHAQKTTGPKNSILAPVTI